LRPRRFGVILTIAKTSKEACDNRKCSRPCPTRRAAGSELAEHFPITKGSLSHHFNVLKAADLVRVERRGQSLVYSLNTTVFEDVASMLLDLFAMSESRAEPVASPAPEKKRKSP
jgi:DNA-binding transcriptional ArsR family regulator